MSSIVYQGFPSCAEPGHLKSKKTQSISFQDPPEKDTDDSENYKNNKPQSIPDDKDLGWSSFILTVATSAANHSSQTKAAVELEQAYVHPLMKKSFSSLSTKSLEMCTESLGSETGSNIDEFIDDLSNNLIEKLGHLNFKQSKKMNRGFNSFPPPLTSITGSEITRVKPHRECGRLILKAISSSNSSFQAERVNGRLKLYSIMKDDFQDQNFSQQDCMEQLGNGIADYNEKDDDFDVDSMGPEDESYYSESEMQEIDDGKFVEMEEFLRAIKCCKETGPRKMGMLSWGPNLVAISPC